MQFIIRSREKKYISWDYRDLCKSSRGLVIRVSLFHLIQSQAFAKPGDWFVWHERDTGPVFSNCGAARSVRRGWLTHEIHILVSQDLYPALAKHRECFAWHEDTIMKLIMQARYISAWTEGHATMGSPTYYPHGCAGILHHSSTTSVHGWTQGSSRCDISEHQFLVIVTNGASAPTNQLRRLPKWVLTIQRSRVELSGWLVGCKLYKTSQ